MAKRKINQISVIQPLQTSTVHVIPNSCILGGLDKKVDVIGNKFADLITVARVSDANPVYDGVFRFTCTAEKKFKVTNQNTNVTSDEYDATSQNVVCKDVYGITMTVKSGLEGVVVGDTVDVYIVGDSTFIVPGTVLGRIKDESSDNFGKYEPIGSNLDKYDNFRIAGDALETNKENYNAPISDTMVNNDNYTINVYVFAEVIESACRDINLTTEVKDKLQGIVWL